MPLADFAGVSAKSCVTPLFQVLDEASAVWRAEFQRQLELGPFIWGYLLSIIPAGCLIGWTGGHKMLGYSHLFMSITSLLTPMAIQFMHPNTVAGLKFIAGLMAVSIICDMSVYSSLYSRI